MNEQMFDSHEVDQVDSLEEEIWEQSEELDEKEGEQLDEALFEDDEVTDEELDQIADTAISVIEDILKHFSIGSFTIEEYEGDEGELILDITGDDLAVLIGRHGKTLDSLQFLVSSITVRKIGYRYPVVVDVEGYKSRQRQKIESLALSTAKRVKTQKRSIRMRPMTPYERRLVHIALRDVKGITTGSEGEGNSRHVVVSPA